MPAWEGREAASQALARRRREDIGDKAAREVHEALVQGVGAADAPPSVPVLDGGPCRTDEPLCLMELVEGDVATLVPPELDVLVVPLALAAAASPRDGDGDGDGDDDGGITDEGDGDSCMASRRSWRSDRGDAALDDADDAAFNTARWLDQQRRLTESLQSMYPSRNAEPAAPTVCLAEPAVAVELAKHGKVRTALIIVGAAVWSKEQLLAESARGSWGLCEALHTDVPFERSTHHGLSRVALQQHVAESTVRAEQQDGSASDHGNAPLWTACWASAVLSPSSHVHPMRSSASGDREQGALQLAVASPALGLVLLLVSSPGPLARPRAGDRRLPFGARSFYTSITVSIYKHNRLVRSPRRDPACVSKQHQQRVFVINWRSQIRTKHLSSPARKHGARTGKASRTIPARACQIGTVASEQRSVPGRQLRRRAPTTSLVSRATRPCSQPWRQAPRWPS